MACLTTYEPTNTLKQVADDLWIVDGPLIDFPVLGFGVPFTTRMTVVRLADNGLWIHSPTEPGEPLLSELAALGEVRYLIAPSRLHYWWVGEWKRHFPRALTYAAPRMPAPVLRHVGGFDRELSAAPPSEWSASIDQVLAAGDFLTEVDFFHRTSRTLILTDLIENFEPGHVRCWHLKLLLKIGGVADPDGKMPRDMRLTFLRQRQGLRAAVERMLAWRPERIILAHGRWYARDAEAELRRAFRWLL